MLAKKGATMDIRRSFELALFAILLGGLGLPAPSRAELRSSSGAQVGAPAPSLATRAPEPAPLRADPTSGVPQSFTAAQPPEGRVHSLRIFDNDFAWAYLVELTPATQDFMLAKYERGLAFAPYFDEFTDWYARAWEYEDLYAIYNCEQFGCAPYWAERTAYIFEQHPEWVLHGEDDAGQPIPLFIRFGCEVDGCPQFAADVGNPAFRQFWIDAVAESLEAAEAAGFGYRGIFVDDVNLDLDRSVVRVAEGLDGEPVTSPGDPIDPRTGEVMTPEAWRGYVADFLEEVRAAFPFHEIVHNPVWFHSDPDDEAWLRAVDAADIVNFERGMIDDGLTAGFGPFGVASFFAMNDVVHERKRRLTHYVHRPAAADALEEEQQLEYALAGWLLVSGGRDFFGSEARSTPDDWWSGFDTYLGAALGDREYFEDDGLYVREFEHGLVLLREPVASDDTIEVELGDPYLDQQGKIVWDVELAARTGFVLRRVLAADSFKVNP